MSLLYTGGPNGDGYRMGWPARDLADAEIVELGLDQAEMLQSGLYEAAPATKAGAIKPPAPAAEAAAAAPEPVPQPVTPALSAAEGPAPASDSQEAGPAPAPSQFESTTGGNA